MTADEQRIAIAEACPEVFVRPVGHATWNYKSSIVGRVLPCIDGNPLKDLNAMREVEKLLQNKFKRDWSVYWQYLSHVEPHPIFATAAQRAEAFLRTIGKWKDLSESS